MIDEDLTPEEMFADFEPDEEWWTAYLEWASACNDAAQRQYEEEQGI